MQPTTLPIVSLDEVVQVRIVDELKSLFPFGDETGLRESVREALQRVGHLAMSRAYERSVPAVPSAMDRNARGHLEMFERLKR
jgi:hypothetical protein